jgi:Zn-dependent peptidase ImmA (M78 family)
MKNPMIDNDEAKDIHVIIRKILRGLGNPEPPIRLEQVRELLKLDRQFYTSTDTGLLREFVSRMYVAGKQIIMRPMLLLDAIKKAQISALWVPDKRRILIDESKPKLKHRWNEAHEIVHGIIPWHDELLFGDTELSLRPTCHARLEAEANFGAGQFLFLQQRFTADGNDCTPSIKAVKGLAGRFGNTITSTLWRFVEETHVDKMLVGVVSKHPHKESAPLDGGLCRYFIQSPNFRERFSTVSEPQMLATIDSYCRWFQRGGMIGEEEVVLTDDNGQCHIFFFESFYNSHEVLTLGMYRRKRRLSA